MLQIVYHTPRAHTTQICSTPMWEPGLPKPGQSYRVLPDVLHIRTRSAGLHDLQFRYHRAEPREERCDLILIIACVCRVSGNRSRNMDLRAIGLLRANWPRVRETSSSMHPASLSLTPASWREGAGRVPMHPLVSTT